MYLLLLSVAGLGQRRLHTMNAVVQLPKHATIHLNGFFFCIFLVSLFGHYCFSLCLYFFAHAQQTTLLVNYYRCEPFRRSASESEWRLRAVCVPMLALIAGCLHISQNRKEATRKRVLMLRNMKRASQKLEMEKNEECDDSLKRITFEARLSARCISHLFVFISCTISSIDRVTRNTLAPLDEAGLWLSLIQFSDEAAHETQRRKYKLCMGEQISRIRFWSAAERALTRFYNIYSNFAHELASIAFSWLK